MISMNNRLSDVLLCLKSYSLRDSKLGKQYLSCRNDLDSYDTCVQVFKGELNQSVSQEFSLCLWSGSFVHTKLPWKHWRIFPPTRCYHKQHTVWPNKSSYIIVQLWLGEPSAGDHLEKTCGSIYFTLFASESRGEDLLHVVAPGFLRSVAQCQQLEATRLERLPIDCFLWLTQLNCRWKVGSPYLTSKENLLTFRKVGSQVSNICKGGVTIWVKSAYMSKGFMCGYLLVLTDP